MLIAGTCGLAAAAVLAWRRAGHEPSAYQPGTFFGLLFLAGLLAPGIPAAILEGGPARAYVVPLVLALSVLLGVAACVRPPEEEWTEDEEPRR
jgi:asparagine N-glycosylation enzyme membrane subunit Stt3